MVWLRFVQHSDRRRPNPRRNEVVVVAPPNRNAVEQLVELQQSLAQVGDRLAGRLRGVLTVCDALSLTRSLCSVAFLYLPHYRDF